MCNNLLDYAAWCPVMLSFETVLYGEGGAYILHASVAS